ncbi:unnamed protein product [Blepharisma stoltei]|uniref:RPGR-interacting protein 1 first C2 domain-containing protein n=1 Tax=Blepharisma stoltei TaxID=1481888 RepID=A0AAU9JNB8_9CILI|nr:unnamed protein product [Blepharisma stoltei]
MSHLMQDPSRNQNHPSSPSPTVSPIDSNQPSQHVSFSNQPTPHISMVQSSQDKFFRSSKNQSPLPGKSPQLLKTAKTQLKTRNFSSLNDKQKTEAYYDLYDRNLELKQMENELKERIKQLVTQLTKLTADIKYERTLLEGGENSEVKLIIDDLNSKNQKLMQENNNLKSKIKELSSKSLRGAKQPSGKSVKLSSEKTMTLQPAVIEKQKRLEEIIVERDSLILKLKEQLQSSEEVISQLRNEKLAVLGKIPTEKMYKLSDFEEKVETLTESYEAQSTYLEVVKQMLEESEELLRKEKLTSFDLSLKVKELEANSVKEPYELKIQELTQEKIQLELKIKELCDTPIIRDAKGLSDTTYNILENEIVERHKLIIQYKTRISELENEHIKLNEMLRLVQAERNKLKEENLILAYNLEKRAKYVEEFESKLVWLARDNDTDAFMRALGMLKLGLNGKEWPVVEPFEENSKLKQENEKLTVEKGEIAAELKKCQNLLELRDQIENEKVSLIQSENEKLNCLLRSAQKRIDELSRLAEYRGSLASRGSQEIQRNFAMESYGFGAGFKEDGSEVGVGQNIFDLLIVDAEFYNKALETDGISFWNKLVTCLSVDFYDHETQITSLCEGLQPKYDIHMSFLISMDQLFLRYLHEGYVVIDVNIVNRDKFIPIAKAQIPLLNLLGFSKPESNRRVIESACILTSWQDDKKTLGGLRYKIKMRHPLNDLYALEQTGVIENPITINATKAMTNQQSLY